MTPLQEALASLIECARLLGQTQALKGPGIYTEKDARFECAMHEAISKHSTALRTALAQQELPQKERPDFMAGYDAGMADAKRMTQQGEPVAYITETEQGPMVWTPEMYGEACTYCDDGEFPVPLYTAAPAPQAQHSQYGSEDLQALILAKLTAPQAQEPARNVTKEEDAILRGALLRSGTVIHPKPAPQPAQEPVKFLANGTRFKMSFFQNEDEEGNYTDGTHVMCFDGYENVLDGRWVALVAAEDDCHLQSTQPRELTDEEILSLEKQTPAMNDAGEEWIYFARAVLKKARE